MVTNLYDGFGRVMTQYTEGDPHQTWQVYWSGFVNVEADPQGGQRQFIYDDQSRLTGMEDALSNLSRTFYDGQDHVVMTISPLNETNQFAYDANQNLLYATDPLGFSNTIVYDGNNNLVTNVDKLGNAGAFGYNAQFSLIGSTNGAGDWVTFTYNTDGTPAGSMRAGRPAARPMTLRAVDRPNGVGPGKQVNGVDKGGSSGDDADQWRARCELNMPARCIT